MRGPLYLDRLMTEGRVSLVPEVGAKRYVWGAVPKQGRGVQWEVDGEKRVQPVDAGTFKVFVFFI